jgi:hypothetical protein
MEARSPIIIFTFPGKLTLSVFVLKTDKKEDNGHEILNAEHDFDPNQILLYSKF